MPQPKKKKARKATPAGAFRRPDGKLKMPNEFTQHEMGSWMREVESVGISLNKAPKRWKQIQQVLDIIRRCNGLEPREEISLLSIIPDGALKRKTPEGCKWSIKTFLKFTLQQGTNSTQYKNAKEEYERVKNNHDQKVGRFDGPRMVPWETIRDVWLDGAKFISLFYACHPEMTREQAYDESKTIAEEKYVVQNDGMTLIKEYFHVRAMTWTHDAAVNAIRKASLVPNPKWPGDRGKDLKQFVYFKKKQDENAAALIIRDFISRRSESLPCAMFSAIRANSSAADIFGPMRNWCKHVLANPANLKRATEKIDERITQSFALSWSKILTAEEAKNPPIPKPSKKRQHELSFGFKEDEIYQYIGTGTLQNGLPQYQSLEDFNKSAVTDLVKYWNRGCTRNYGPRLKEVRQAKIAPPDSNSWLLKASCLDLVRVIHVTATNTGIDKDRPVPLYCYLFPNPHNTREYSTAQSFFQGIFSKDICGAHYDIEDELNKKEVELRPFETSDHFKFLTNLMRRLEDFREHVSSSEDFAPVSLDDSTTAPVFVFFNGGDTWKELWIGMIVPLVMDLQKSDKEMDEVLELWRSSEFKSQNRPPKLQKAPITAGDDSIGTMDPPGSCWNEKMRQRICKAFDFMNLMYASNANIPQGIAHIAEINDQYLTRIFLVAAEMHMLNRMGRQNEHFKMGLDTWLPAFLEDTFEKYACAFCRLSTLLTENGKSFNDANANRVLDKVKGDTKRTLLSILKKIRTKLNQPDDEDMEEAETNEDDEQVQDETEGAQTNKDEEDNKQEVQDGDKTDEEGSLITACQECTDDMALNG